MILCGILMLFLLLLPVFAYRERARSGKGKDNDGEGRRKGLREKRDGEGGKQEKNYSGGGRRKGLREKCDGEGGKQEKNYGGGGRTKDVTKGHDGGRPGTNIKTKKGDRFPEVLYIIGEWLRKRVTSFRHESPLRKQRRSALLISESEENARRAMIFGGMWLLMLIGSIAGCCIGLRNRIGAEAVSSVSRPAFGEETQVLLSVDGLSKPTNIDITVTGLVPDEAGMERIFEETFEAMKETWLAENASSGEIRSDLNLTTEAANGIRFSWKSGNIDLVTDYGTVLSEAIPSEGADVTMQLHMSYGKYESTALWQLRVYPPEEVLLTETEKLQKLIDERDRDTSTEEKLLLPEEMEGNRLQYAEKRNSPYPVLVLFFGLAAVVGILPEEKRKEDYRKRNAELERSLPNVLSKLETLTGAGMSIRGAWFRIADDYEKGREDGTKTVCYAYEEMLNTARAIRGGAPEKEAYVEFGRRCGLHSYVKLGNLLAKSVRQGISGLSGELREESEKALIARKELALRAGETAGTKLLLPMVLMLGIVITILIIPAFMSF